MDSHAYSHARDAAHLSRLVHLICEAGTRPEKWNNVVAAIAQSFGTSKALLFTPHVAPQDGGLVFASGLGDEAVRLLCTTCLEEDWSRRIEQRRFWNTGEVWLDGPVPCKGVVAATVTQESLRHIGLAKVCTGFVFADDAPARMATSLAVFRDTGEPAFNEADMEWMKLVVSHVSRSLAGMWQLGSDILKYTSALSSFDYLPFGVALLDAELRVLHMNKAAKAAVERRDGIFINATGQLDGPSSMENHPGLFQWLTTVRDANGKGPANLPCTCRIQRIQSEKHYAIRCFAIPPESVWKTQHQDSCHVAFITSPSAQRLPTAERLMELYELTHCQAKVALAFANGDSYKNVARRLSISEETVRSHVKGIYPKTRVNRQVDLVRLVLSLSENGL